MEAIGRVAAVDSWAMSPVAGVKSLLRLNAGASPSSADCCTFRSPLGLGGKALSRRKSARLSLRSARPRGRFVSAVDSSYVPILQRDSLFEEINVQELAAESPSLLAECSDLDWTKSVNDLRSEALHSLQSADSRALSLKVLEKMMSTWIHDRMVEGVNILDEQSSREESGWSYGDAVQELRWRANLQAAQELAMGVDASFDWETEAAELHRRVLTHGGAEPPDVSKPEQGLWQAWVCARQDMTNSSDWLAQDVLSSADAQVGVQDLKLLVDKKNASNDAQTKSLSLTSDSNFEDREMSWFSVGAAVATSLAVQGTSVMDAVASETGISIEQNPESAEAASRAPSWLVPAVLAFPVLSYFLFNVYRDKVNPYAKLTDWMFTVVAVVIVANIVMMAAWGVRLY